MTEIFGLFGEAPPRSLDSISLSPYTGAMQNPLVDLGARRAQSELERVYRADGPRLQRAIMLFTGDRDVADDAVAEAFAQALRRGDAIRSPLAWVWRAAFRIAAGEMKERRLSISSTESGSDDAYEQIEPAFELIAALGKLSRNSAAR